MNELTETTKIKVCHLASYFETSHLYTKMMEHLAALDVEQLVVSPRGFKKATFQHDAVEFLGKTLWKPMDSYWYSGKIKKYNKYVSQISEFDQYDLCHAHSLYSDGIIAYNLKQKFGTPYIVTVRNTDLRIFARFFLHLKPQARKIIVESSTVIFANHQYPARLAKLLNIDTNDFKYAVIPNGVDSYWFNKHTAPSIKREDIIDVISVGNIIKLKNHITLIKAINKYNSTRSPIQPQMRLTIVGDYQSKYGTLLKNRFDSSTIRFAGKLEFTEIVSKMQNSTVFALLSWRENFGIAYAEAVSQGLPIIFTRGEGFDGWAADGEWGYACNFNDQDEFIRLTLLLNDSPQIPDQKAVEKIHLMFSWQKIATDIRAIYQSTKSH